MNKNFMAGVGLGVVAIIAFIFLNLGGAAKAVIEKAGSSALGTAVKVQGLDISIADKTASMKGLLISNPKGFKTSYLLDTDSISVSVGDISQKEIVMKDITVDGMKVTYEIGPNGANFNVIQKNLKSPPADKKNEKDSSAKDAVKVVIQNLIIKNAEIIPAIGGTAEPVKMPDIIIRNIGRPGAPVPAVQAAAQIMNRIMAVASQAALQNGLTKGLSDALGKAAGDAPAAAKALKGLISQ